MTNHKLIFSGSANAGKTTAIAAISDIKPFLTDELATEGAPARTDTPETGMDYGVLRLDGGEQLHLYGTPSNAGFDFVWEALTDDGIGLVLLINNQRPDPLADLQFYLSAFAGFVKTNALAIGLTRVEAAQGPSVEDYQRLLQENGLTVPVFEVDAREPADIALLVQALLHNADPGGGH